MFHSLRSEQKFNSPLGGLWSENCGAVVLTTEVYKYMSLDLKQRGKQQVNLFSYFLTYITTSAFQLTGNNYHF